MTGNNAPLFIKATAMIRNQDGKVLLVQRAKNQRNADFWEFPGGKLNAGERVVEGLRRELQEELNIFPIKYKFITLVKLGRYETYAYEVTQFEGDIILKEHQAAQWVSLDMLKKYKLLPAERIIRREILKRETDSIISNLAKLYTRTPEYDKQTKKWYIEHIENGQPVKQYFSTQQEAFKERFNAMNKKITELRTVLAIDIKGL